jgi:gliding motility-associated-like protein
MYCVNPYVLLVKFYDLILGADFIKKLGLYKTKFLVLFFLLGIQIIFSHELYATHNRAGEITYEQIGPLRIRMLLVTYTKASSSAADRDSVEILWGDGTTQWVGRTNGTGEILPNDIKRNEYIQEHTYPSRGTYTIFFTDPNRIGNILNINFPNSIDIQFSLTCTFTLLDPQFQGLNSSVKLLQPPIDFACVGTRFIHNPNAFDADGDSLAYEFAIPTQGPDNPVPNYQFPDRILPGPNNIIQLNPITGEFIWQSPPQQGEYNVAIKINEFRQGVLINSTIRDMQILVRACMNNPPVIETIDEICVIAGQKLVIPLSINDPDSNQLVELTASGAPFLLTNPAFLTVSNRFLAPPFNSIFEWNTDCNHISSQPYKLVIRAVDNFFGDTSGLATIKTILIKVVGPPPVLTSVVAEDNEAVVRWEDPYACENARDDYFLGFSIWRSERSSTFPNDSCELGVDKSVYTKIVFITKQRDALSYLYRDRDIVPGKVYCYRILGEFARLTSTGNPFGLIESLQSNEMCFSTTRVIPYITRVSVFETSANTGKMDLLYTKPNDSNFNSIAFPGPYRIELYRRQVGTQNFLRIDDATRSFTDFSQNIDTSFLDQNLNTQLNSFEYQVRFFTAAGEFGVSQPATSIFLSIEGTKERNNLSWMSMTPWSNQKFYIHRRAPNSSTFELHDSTLNTVYADVGLLNGEEYCYFVVSSGSYNIPFIASPLFNSSQIACAIPVDNRPPCPPNLTVINLCDQIQTSSLEDLKNFLSWTDPNSNCLYFEKVESYRIYFRPDSLTDDEIIAQIPATSNRTYDHISDQFGLQGCYTVTAIDSLGNESIKSNRVCLDNCPIYELPNTFTPNGDGNNDRYEPSKNYFISRVSMKIYNQWGTLIFETNDPSINWDGEASPEGTYYYTCKVFKRNLDGTESETISLLSGYINLLR